MSIRNPDKSIERFRLADPEVASKPIPLLVKQFYLALGKSNGIRTVLLDTEPMPPILKTDTASLDISFSQVIDDFASAHGARPRVTLCLSDGVVFYDSHRGREVTEIDLYFFSKSNKIWNFHTTRKELQQGTLYLWGSATRSSSTMPGGIKYDYYAFWIKVVDNVIGVRIALENPLPVLT